MVLTESQVGWLLFLLGVSVASLIFIGLANWVVFKALDRTLDKLADELRKVWNAFDELEYAKEQRESAEKWLARCRELEALCRNHEADLEEQDKKLARIKSAIGLEETETE